jgi:WD40 repeat protein/MinD-like ATPase involved in chromosome partitioning or flagellar assembly
MSSRGGARAIPAAPEIITFYSYKGGTGRSMALANIAFILAGNGYRVLVIDWDLEAPGLHRYFHPFLKDKELNTSDGIIDFVVDYATNAVSTGELPDDWYVPFGNILRCAVSLDFRFPSAGVIDFVPAGRQGPDYAAKVNSFNWQHFYEQLDGGIFLEFSKKSMAGYHFVLIDSRTGVSDTSGICTVQMPEKLVVCFTPNSQSIEGAAAVAESAYHQRIKPDGTPGLRILPVLTRVERGEQERIQIAKDLARVRFDDLLGYMQPAARDEYWSRISVPHEPYYAFEEVLSVFAEKPDQAPSMLATMKLIGEYVTAAELKFPEIDEGVREAVMDRFARRMKRKVIRTLSAEAGGITDIGLSSDGTRAVSGHAKGTAVIWDVEPGRVRHTLPVQRTRKTGVAISADGRRVAVGARGFSVWDADSGEVLAEIGGIEDITAISLNADGALALCCSDDKVELWDLEKREHLRTFAGHRDWVRTVALSGDGRLALSGGDDKTAILWDVQTGEALSRLQAHKDWVRSVAISHEGRVALTGSDDGSAIVWDLAKGEPRHIWTRHNGPVAAVSLNGDGKRAISGGEDGRIFFWDVESGQPLRLLAGHAGAVTTLMLSAGGRRAMSGGVDGNVMLWDTEAGEPVETVEQPVTEAPKTPPPAEQPRDSRPAAARKQDLPPSPVSARPSPAGKITPRNLFFISYARADWDDYLEKFFRDLTAELRVFGTSYVPGFIDTPSSQPKEAWSDAVQQALDTSLALVAVYSPNYFASNHTGREFAAFRQDPSRLIAPIVWNPVPQVPPAAKQVQYVDTNFPGVYRREGLRYIMRLKRHGDAYSQVVHELAERLESFGRAHPQSLRPLPPLDEIESVFHSEEPVSRASIVGFDCLAPTRSESQENGLPTKAYGHSAWDWIPFGQRSARQICQATAKELALRYEEVALSEEEVRRLAPQKSPIIVLLDPDALWVPRLRTLLDALVALSTDDFAFVTTSKLSGFWPSISIGSDEEGLSAAITRAITEIRLRMIARGNVEPSTGPLPQLLPRESKH